MAKRPGPRSEPTRAAIGFTELSSTDSQITRTFLEKAFQWEFQEIQMPQGSYLSYRSPEGTTLGIRPANRSENPVSVNYVRVEDLKEAEKSVMNAGGEIILPRTDIPGMGSFFWFRIPSGPLMACWQDTKKPTSK